MMYHLCMDIRGFMRNHPNEKDYRGVFQHDDGKPMTPREAREHLLDQLQLGRKVIPCDKCSNFDYQKGCQGHPDDDGVRALDREGA